MDAVIASSPAARKASGQRHSEAFLLKTQKTSLNDYRGLYLQAAPSALKRLRYRLRYLAPTTEDYRWVERHHINRGLTIFLRPFRLLHKYGAVDCVAKFCFLRRHKCCEIEAHDDAVALLAETALTVDEWPRRLSDATAPL